MVKTKNMCGETKGSEFECKNIADSKKKIISFESRETLMTSKTIILKFLKRIASLSVISFPQIISFTLYKLKSKYGQEMLLTL